MIVNTFRRFYKIILNKVAQTDTTPLESDVIPGNAEKMRRT
jgi:hypothetical protein